MFFFFFSFFSGTRAIKYFNCTIRSPADRTKLADPNTSASWRWERRNLDIYSLFTDFPKCSFSLILKIKLEQNCLPCLNSLFPIINPMEIELWTCQWHPTAAMRIILSLLLRKSIAQWETNSIVRKLSCQRFMHKSAWHGGEGKTKGGLHMEKANMRPWRDWMMEWVYGDSSLKRAAALHLNHFCN